MPDLKGKGWSRGLSAATDLRVAKSAAALRGMAYARRRPVAECKWGSAGRTTLPLEWSNSMAYVVGLTATDGCLVSGAAESTSNQRTVSRLKRISGCSDARIESDASERERAALFSSRKSETRACTSG